MNSPDQSQSATEANDQANERPFTKRPTGSPTKAGASMLPQQVSGFDWTALGVVILISAFFAITARINAQPATSFVPAAVLSATGCGLLVTAFRKLRTSKGVGFLEAALGGFVIAFFQCVVALTYPGVFDSLSLGQILRDDFLITWSLVICFSIIFSMAGAALGHLAFAPLRPLPTKSSITVTKEDEDNEGIFERQSTSNTVVEEELQNAAGKENEDLHSGNEDQDTPIESEHVDLSSPQLPQRSAFSYLLTILLLGLAPTVAAYVFSAAYDFTLSFNQFIPGPYPTLRLLSALLPWQVPIPIDMSSNIRNIIIFSLLWRIPLFLGNPTSFDLQALEPYIFNSAALGLLLLTMHRTNSNSARQSSQLGWMVYLSLEAIFGLILVLPANLWVLRGLEGLLQFHGIVIPIRTLSILNPRTFSLNLITGPLVCIGIGLVLRKLFIRRNI
jgi:hypothetical protein